MSTTGSRFATVNFIQFPAKTIATACVYLAGQFAKVRPIGGKEWLTVLDCHDVEAIVCKYFVWQWDNISKLNRL